jgi:hypothetical protein
MRTRSTHASACAKDFSDLGALMASKRSEGDCKVKAAAEMPIKEKEAPVRSAPAQSKPPVFEKEQIKEGVKALEEELKAQAALEKKKPWYKKKDAGVVLGATVVGVCLLVAAVKFFTNKNN